jgi:hypothetical protein
MTRPVRTRPPIRYIYVIGPQSGWQKVGLAIDPQTRLDALQTASGLDLMLHASVAVPFGEAHAVERQAHQALARCRVRNEWFETTPAAAVAAVHKAAGPWIGQAASVRRETALIPADRELPLFAFEPAARTADRFTPEALLNALEGSVSPLPNWVAVVALFKSQVR